jgi:hypothetical protein
MLNSNAFYRWHCCTCSYLCICFNTYFPVLIFHFLFLYSELILDFILILYCYITVTHRAGRFTLQAPARQVPRASTSATSTHPLFPPHQPLQQRPQGKCLYECLVFVAFCLRYKPERNRRFHVIYPLPTPPSPLPLHPIRHHTHTHTHTHTQAASSTAREPTAHDGVHPGGRGARTHSVVVQSAKKRARLKQHQQKTKARISAALR